MKTIEYRVVTWNKITLPDSVDLEEVKQKLQEGIDPFDLCFGERMLESKKLYEECDFDNLIETEYVLSPEENGGYSTIEIYLDKQLFWQNGKEED